MAPILHTELAIGFKPAKLYYTACGSHLENRIPSLTQFWFLIAFCAAAALWWSSMKAREIAIRNAQSACKKHNMQFLDQTVALRRMRPKRDAHGNPCWQRDYAFEYTSTASTEDGVIRSYRDSGTVRLLGLRVKTVDLPFVRDNEGNRVYIQ